MNFVQIQFISTNSFFKKKLTRMHKFLAVDFLSISYDQTIHELHPR